MIFNGISIMIGAMILIGGIYYLIKEKEDGESKKIYSIVSASGAVIVIGMALKILIAG